MAAVPEKWAQAVVRKLETQAYRPKPLPEQAPAMHFVVEKGLEKNSKFVILPLPENLNDEEVAVQFQTGDLVTMAKPSSKRARTSNCNAVSTVVFSSTRHIQRWQRM